MHLLKEVPVLGTSFAHHLGENVRVSPRAVVMWAKKVLVTAVLLFFSVFVLSFGAQESWAQTALHKVSLSSIRSTSSGARTIREIWGLRVKRVQAHARRRGTARVTPIPKNVKPVSKNLEPDATPLPPVVSTSIPIGVPTAAPTVNSVTPAPTTAPTSAPTRVATPNPTSAPTSASTAVPRSTPTVRPTIAATVTVAPLPAGIMSKYEQNMKSFGQTHCSYLTDPTLNADQRLGGTYYDAIWVYTQIQRYTKDASWRPCVLAALKGYGTDYIGVNNGAIPGYWVFTRGLLEEYLTSGNEVVRSYIDMLNQNGSFIHDATPNAWLLATGASRENAYALYAKIAQFEAGEGLSPRTTTLVENALGHINQWFVLKNAPYIRPFMVALTARSLIQYWEMNPDPRIIPALKIAADSLWAQMWLPSQAAFKYTNVDTALFSPATQDYNTGGMDPAPDLNPIIAPLYFWLYRVTGDTSYVDKGDQIFIGGVNQAFLQGIKQFNQSYFWSMAGLTYRNAPPLTQ